MSEGGNLIWSVKSWSSSIKYESNSIKFNNTDFKLSIIPNKTTLYFELTLKQISPPSNPKSAQIIINFMLDDKKNNCRFEIPYPYSDKKLSIDTKIPISKFSSHYNEKDFVVNFSVLPSEKNSARPPSKADRNANNRGVNSRVNNTNPLSTISSPSRGQSVKNLGRQSTASTSSTSSTAAQNSVTRKNSFRSNKTPTIFQPKPNNSSKRQFPKVTTTSDQTINSENSSNSKPRLPIDQISKQQKQNSLTGSSSSSRKPNGTSPAAVIAASKASNSNFNQNNLPNTPISEPKASPKTSATSPSAAIASKNSQTVSNSKNSHPNNLPPILHNPRNNQPPINSQKVSTPTSPTEVSTTLVPSPHPPDPEDSYAGLSNQGATCYMNSVLQSLFHIPLFRRSVFELPTEDETDKEHSIPLNLQALFCSLLLAPEELKEEQKKQNENKTENSNLASAYISKYVKPVSTKNLTKSFGWNSSETLQQQDIQEFFRVLLNKLDDKIDEKNKKSKEAKENSENEEKKKNGKSDKKTNNDDEENKEEVKHVSDIFKGQTIFTISGEKVDFKSERYEDFYDLSLSVKDCSNLENSFLQFTKKEQLSDSYDTGIEGHEKIAVQIQAQLFKLPKILTLHLQRFEYDFVHDSLTKIYDELKFPKVLDTTPFLHNMSPFKKQGKNCSTFTLTGVLIHSGDASFGHYYVYLRPKLFFNEDGSLNEEKSSFYEFNDSSVHRVKDEEAIDDNFGGCDNYLNESNSYQSTYMSYKRHSAYMLIYSRNDCLHEIYDTSYDIPNYIKEYSKSCQRVQKSTKKIISYFTDDAIKMNTEDGKSGIYNEKAIQAIKISSDSSYEQLYDEIATILNCKVSNLRLWKLDYMKEIDKWIPDSGKLSTILPKSGTIFVQYKPETESTEVTKDQILLVIKLYTKIIQCPILYAASILFSRSSKVKELKKKISDLLRLPNDAVVRLFEELPPQSYSKQFIDELTDDESTLFMSNKSLRSGSSIIVQTSIQPSNDILKRIFHSFKDQERINDRNFYEEILNYVDYMVAELPDNLTDYIEMKRNVRRMRLLDYQRSSNSNFIKLKEIEKYDDQNELKDYGIIEFPHSINLDQLINFIEQIIPTKFDKNQFKIFLFRYSSRVDGPSPFPLKSISDLTSRTQYLYMLLVPINTPIDYQDKMTVNIAFSDNSFVLRYNLFFYSPVNLKVSKIVDGFSWIKIKKVKPKLRALQMKNSKILKVLTGDEKVSIFNDSILRIEIVPESTEPFKEISVCNAVISNSSSDTFKFLGFPFLLQVADDETVDDVRKKISRNLNWNSEKMNHVRLYCGPEDKPFDIEKVLKKGQKILECVDIEKGQRLIMIHSSEDSYRDDYSIVTSGVQIH